MAEAAAGAEITSDDATLFAVAPATAISFDSLRVALGLRDSDLELRQQQSATDLHTLAETCLSIADARNEPLGRVAGGTTESQVAADDAVIAPAHFATVIPTRRTESRRRRGTEILQRATATIGKISARIETVFQRPQTRTMASRVGALTAVATTALLSVKGVCDVIAGDRRPGDLYQLYGSGKPFTAKQLMAQHHGIMPVSAQLDIGQSVIDSVERGAQLFTGLELVIGAPTALLVGAAALHLWRSHRTADEAELHEPMSLSSILP